MRTYNEFRQTQSIAATRIRLGMSQEAFALALGISRSLLSKIENRKRSMPLLALAELSALEIKMAAVATVQRKTVMQTEHCPAAEFNSNYPDICLLRARKCRGEAQNLQFELDIMIAKYTPIAKAWAATDALIRQADPVENTFHFSNLSLHRYELERKLEKCGLAAQNALQHRIALKHSEADLHEVSGRAMGGRRSA